MSDEFQKLADLIAVVKDPEGTQNRLSQILAAIGELRTEQKKVAEERASLEMISAEKIAAITAASKEVEKRFEFLRKSETDHRLALSAWQNSEGYQEHLRQVRSQQIGVDLSAPGAIDDVNRRRAYEAAADAPQAPESVFTPSPAEPSDIVRQDDTGFGPATLTRSVPRRRAAGQ